MFNVKTLRTLLSNIFNLLEHDVASLLKGLIKSTSRTNAREQKILRNDYANIKARFFTFKTYIIKTKVTDHLES